MSTMSGLAQLIRQYPPSPPPTWVQTGPAAVRAVPLSCKPEIRIFGSVGCCAMKLVHRQDSPLFWLANSPAFRGSGLRNPPPSHVPHHSFDPPGLGPSACATPAERLPIKTSPFPAASSPPALQAP